MTIETMYHITPFCISQISECPGLERLAGRQETLGPAMSARCTLSPVLLCRDIYIRSMLAEVAMGGAKRGWERRQREETKRGGKERRVGREREPP